MKQTQHIKPIPHGNLVDCSASLKKLTALQAPIPILSVCVCTPELRCTGGNNDITAGTDTDIVGACKPALTVYTVVALFSAPLRQISLLFPCQVITTRATARMSYRWFAVTSVQVYSLPSIWRPAFQLLHSSYTEQGGSALRHQCAIA